MYGRQGTRASARKRNAKKAKWLLEEALQITVKRREVKSKGEQESYTHLNAAFQRIARRDKKAFLSDQCKEIEVNNRIGKSWRRQWHPTPVLLPGESHGRRGLVGCSLWGCKESDMTKQLKHTHTYTYRHDRAILHFAILYLSFPNKGKWSHCSFFFLFQ